MFVTGIFLKQRKYWMTTLQMIKVDYKVEYVETVLCCKNTNCFIRNFGNVYCQRQQKQDSLAGYTVMLTYVCV